MKTIQRGLTLQETLNTLKKKWLEQKRIDFTQMSLQTKQELAAEIETKIESTKKNGEVFSKDYVDFLSEAGWRLEKKLPSNSNKYSDLLEDTDWKSNDIDFRSSKHYRRDLDALSWYFSYQVKANIYLHIQFSDANMNFSKRDGF